MRKEGKCFPAYGRAPLGEGSQAPNQQMCLARSHPQKSIGEIGTNNSARSKLGDLYAMKTHEINSANIVINVFDMCRCVRITLTVNKSWHILHYKVVPMLCF